MHAGCILHYGNPKIGGASFDPGPFAMTAVGATGVEQAAQTWKRGTMPVATLPDKVLDGSVTDSIVSTTGITIL